MFGSDLFLYMKSYRVVVLPYRCFIVVFKWSNSILLPCVCLILMVWLPICNFKALI